MSEPIVIAIITCLGVVTSALLLYLSAKRSSDMARVSDLEKRVMLTDKVNSGLWIWNRGLQNQVYKKDPPPPIPPPDWLISLMDGK